MTKLLVSFSTRPNRGSEGGVGWSFLRAAIERAGAHREPLYAVVDARDEKDIEIAVGDLPGAHFLHLVGVRAPKASASYFGDSRSRGSYLAWLGQARPVVKELICSTDADVVHQVTFATGVLPAAFSRRLGVRKVWGPLSVPWAAAHAEGRHPAFANQVGIKLGRHLAGLNVRGIDLAIATNALTGRHLNRSVGNVVVEPNIFVDAPRLGEIKRDDELISLMGLLVNGKRPWLAIQALGHPSLKPYRLQVLGDGPLRKPLESYVRQERLGSRVVFRGHLHRNEAIQELASSRVLVHPSIREGAAWVVGEAAAVGVPAVVFENVGAATTVEYSNNGGVICSAQGNLVENLVAGTLQAVAGPRPEPTDRWSAARLPGLLDQWWTGR